MNRLPVADWAATAPWDGIMGKPSTFPSGPVDLSQVTWAGVQANRYPVWNGTRFVPTSLPSSGASSDFTTVTVPGLAYRKVPSGQPGAALQNVWDRFEANVRLWGAAGNGASDDTDAVNEAINAVNADGGSIYFPAGTYIVDAASLSYITSTTRIRGDGIGVSIIDFQNSGGFTVSAPTGAFTVQDISIHGAITSLDADCLGFYALNAAFEGSHRAFDLSSVQDGFASGCLFLSLGTATGVYGNFSGMSFGDLRFIDDEEWHDGIHLNVGTANIFGSIYVGNANQSAIYLGTATSGNRVSNVSFKNILGADPVVNLGTNNYVSDQYGLGGNTNTLYDRRKDLIAAFSWNPPPIPVGTGYYDDFNIPGASFGDQVMPGVPVLFDPSARLQAQIVASDTVRLSVINLGTAAVDIDSGNWRIRVLN